MRMWTIFPDELARAYAWRLRSDNVLSSNDELAAALGAVEGGGRKSSYASDKTTALLGRLEMTAAQLVCGHSLVPVTKCVATFDLSSSARPDFGDSWYLGFALWSGSQARLCRDCVSEDLSFLGISYWRRSHQLPGVTWCTKHRRPLSELRRQNAFVRSPRVALGEVVDLPARDVDTAIRSEVVNRYASILEGLLDSATAPVHSACAAHLIRSQAAVEGLKVMPWGEARYLSDAVTQQVPKRWLAAHFPASQSKRPREFAPWVDQAGHARTKPVGATTFALALAVLWSNPDEALTAFLGANDDTHEAVRPRRKSVELSQLAMRELWIRHEGRHLRIAQELGMCQKMVRVKFNEVGLISVGRTEFQRIEAAKERFDRGQSIVAASRAEGVEVQAVEALIRASLREDPHAASPEHSTA